MWNEQVTLDVPEFLNFVLIREVYQTICKWLGCSTIEFSDTTGVPNGNLFEPLLMLLRHLSRPDGEKSGGMSGLRSYFSMTTLRCSVKPSVCSRATLAGKGE